MQKALLLFCLLIVGTTQAQEKAKKDFTIGFETSIQSEILQEERPILIHLPDGYESSNQSYPVVYLMDGKGHFIHTVGSVKFLSRNGRIPPMIVVGIPNTADRTHDLTPPEAGTDNRFPTAGGADNTLNFIKKELAPYLDDQYRTTPYKVLIGHSFGGLFAIHAMVHHPDLFDAHLAISPSLWWNDQELATQAAEFLNEHPDHQTKLYMTMGNEGGSMLGGAWKLAAVLEEKASEDFSWEFHLMEEETHGSVPHRSTYNGLESMFKDWKIGDLYSVYKEGGMEAIQAHYDQQRATYGTGSEKAPERPVNGLGYQLLNRGFLEEAISVFEHNLQQYPKSLDAINGMGMALNKKGDKAAAIDSYQKLLALNPGDKNAIKVLQDLGVENPSLEIKLDHQILDQYVGTYEVKGMGLKLEVRREGDYLYGKPSGQPEKKMLPFAENKFYLEGENVQVTVHKGEDQKVNGITVQFNGGANEMKAEKIK